MVLYIVKVEEKVSGLFQGLSDRTAITVVYKSKLFCSLKKSPIILVVEREREADVLSIFQESENCYFCTQKRAYVS